jgi:hypothetical protein
MAGPSFGVGNACPVPASPKRAFGYKHPKNRNRDQDARGTGKQNPPEEDARHLTLQSREMISKKHSCLDGDDLHIAISDVASR